MEGWEVDRVETVPVLDGVGGVDRDLGVGFVEVVFVEDESSGKDVADETGEGCFA